MARPKPSKRFDELAKRVAQRSTIRLTGFIAPAPSDDIVRLCPSVNLEEVVDIPESAVIEFKDADSGMTQIVIDASAVVTAISTRRYPIAAAAMARLDSAPGGGSGGTGKTCVEKRIEKCKSDPTVGNKSFCDSKEGKDTFKLLCDLFGDPKFGLGDGGDITIMY